MYLHAYSTDPRPIIMQARAKQRNRTLTHNQQKKKQGNLYHLDNNKFQ
jgi:hypothetical protein